MGSKMMYLTKLKGLATVVWDPKEERAIAEFNKQGLFCTKDSVVADRLVSMGYRKVTADQIKDRGLLLPNEYAPNKPSPAYVADGAAPALDGNPDTAGVTPMEAYLDEQEADKLPENRTKGRSIVR